MQTCRVGIFVRINYSLGKGERTHMKGRKGDALSSVNWMRSVPATPDYARDIIRCAVTEQLVKKRRPNRAWVQPNVETFMRESRGSYG